MKKEFLKIAGVGSEAAFYKKYPTEAAFFKAHPEARNMLAMGGTPEAFPQIATFDKAFSYGVPPGPQYLSHGGSAYPQAQTEQQFFIPIYTDVYNPYNKAMGGSNVEMYPNAKTTPHWGPSNVWFQEGGQEGAPSNNQELDRAGALNRIGSFVNNIKTTAAKANAKNAMMSAIDNVGMAQYGKQLNKYQGATTGSQTGSTPTATTTTPSYMTKDDFTSSFGPAMDEYMKKREQQQQTMMAALLQQAYGYNPRTQGYMNDFLPSVYDWNNLDNFMYREKGSPGFRWKTDVPGQGKKRGVSNMPFIQAYFPELYGDPNAAQKVLSDPKYAERRKQLGLTRYTETPVGLFKRKTKRDYYFGEEPTKSTFKDWGTGTASSASPKGVPDLLMNKPSYTAPPQTPSVKIPGGTMPSSPQPSPGTRAPMLMPGQQGYNPTAASTQSASKPAAASSPSSVNPDVDYITNSKYPGLDEKFVGTNMTQRQDLLKQLNSSDPKEVEYAKYRIGVMNDWDAMQGSTTTTSNPAANAKISTGPTTTTIRQAPSNTNSMDAATVQKKKGPIVNQAYIDDQKAVPSFPIEDYNQFMPQRPDMAGPLKTPVGPVVGPNTYGYGGYTGYKFGGSYRQGDVVYMSDDEIAEFIRNGGQIEEME